VFLIGQAYEAWIEALVFLQSRCTPCACRASNILMSTGMLRVVCSNFHRQTPTIFCISY
jgi:hypothetical protein